ncbi:TonB-dependent receptor [Rhizorhabdus argentea]|uniref:TonB-dependent receptor n=1 Tax=Rhizorhabdus argentea TaxID=1387174 RepID=UPI0030EDCFD7
MERVSTAALALAIAIGANGAAAYAQKNSPDGVAGAASAADEASHSKESVFGGDIVVTATRREASLQKVGISVTAFNEAQLNTLSLESQGDIAKYTPATEFVRFWSGKGVNSVFFIRGLGQADFNEATESPSALYVDEFYILSSGAADFLMHDAARVEILRGPQGSLFGRNTTAGAVNVTNNRPQYDLSGRVTGTVGSFSRREIDGYVNIPVVSDKIALRFSANVESDHGYTRNFFDVGSSPARIHNTDFSSYRGQLLIEPIERLHILYKYQLGKVDASAGTGDLSNPAQAVAGGVISAPTDVFGYSRALDGLNGPYEVDADTIGHVYNKIQIHFGRLDYDLTDNIQISSLTGHFKQVRENTEDCDGSPRTLCNVHDATRQHYLTQELKVAGKSDKLDWTIGGFYLKQKLDATFEVLLFSGTNVASAIGLPAPANGLIQATHTDQSLKSLAGYVNGKYKFNDRLALTAGIRITHDDKEIDETEGLLIHDYADTGLKTAIGQTFGFVDPVFRVHGFDQWDDLRQNHIIGALDPIRRFSRATVGDMAVYKETYYSGELQLDYTPSEDFLVYLGYRRGVKGGGFNNGLFDISATNQSEIPVKKEVNNDFEGGYKWRFGGGLGRLNQSFFYYDYKGYQATAFVGSGASLSTLITNNDAIVYGSEVEVSLSPLAGLDLRMSGSYLHTKVKDVSNRGVIADRKLGRAAKFQVSGIARYEFSALGGTVAPQVDFNWTDKRYVDVVNNAQGLLKAYGQINASLSYAPESEAWHVSAGVINLNATNGPVNIFEVTGAGNVGQINYLPPRRWQLEFGIRF